MPPLTFRNEDEEAQHCLSALRDGTREEKIVARERLAAIFARRGLDDEAAELYELNVRAGVRSPEVFEALSDVYRRLGDLESAEAALAEARRVRSPAAAAVTPQVRSDFAPHAPASPLFTRQPNPDMLAAFDTDETRHAGKSAPGPVLAASVVLFLIVLPVVLLALFVVNPLSLYLEGRAAGPTVETGADVPSTLKIAPGMSATWYVQTGRSVSGLWASPGLDLTLADPAGSIAGTFSVTAPRPQSWGETITIVERRGQGRANQETVVPATFEAPADLPPAGTVIGGRIAGQVMAPRLSENSQFTTTTQSIDIPVQLVVVSGFDLWLERMGNALRMFFDEDRWLLVTIGAILIWCVLAGGAALLFRARRR